MLIIRTDGTTEARFLRVPDRTLSLPEAQRIVGGYVEAIRLPSGVLLVDEDARMKRERPPVNAEASRRFGMELLGDVIFLDSMDELA